MSVLRKQHVPNIQIIEEQYNILHPHNNNSNENKQYNKITFLEMRKRAKQQHENKKKTIMSYLFWLSLYNVQLKCGFSEFLKKYNISIEEYTQFEKENHSNIQKQIYHYISNRKHYNGLVSSNLLNEMKNKVGFKEFVSNNNYELKKFVETVCQNSQSNNDQKRYIEAMNHILFTPLDII